MDDGKLSKSRLEGERYQTPAQRHAEEDRAVLRKNIADATTIIWDRERGHRLKIARMKMQLRQDELGRYLGLDQRMMSALECGKREVVMVTLSRFQAILGKSLNYILFGSEKEKYNEGRITVAYWKSHPTRRQKGEDLAD